MALLEGGHNWKYVDRCPDLRTAGKLLPVGDRVEACLQETTPKPGTPPMVKKFRNSSRPEVGAVCIFHGKANDPDIASTMLHGKRTKQAITAGLLINPVPKTLFQQRLCQLQEAGYFTCKKAPLGRSRDQSPHLPNGLDTLTTTFGLKNLKGLTAGELVNPPKTASQGEKESEPIKRNKWSQPVKGCRFGVPTTHANDGNAVAKSLCWINTRVLVSKNSNDFREKFQPQIGKVLDPIADTLNVPLDHSFGISMPSQNFGVGDLMDSCYSEKFLKGSERHQSIVTAVQERLKKANFQKFNSLLQAFKYYDMKNQGWIDREDLQKVCTQLDLVLSPQILDSLMDYCDVNKDGKIDFTEFANFLNWKGRTPINAQEQQILTGVLKPSSAPALVRRLKIQELGERNLSVESEALVRPEDLELIRANSTLKTPKTLSRPRSVPCNFGTSSSVIGATVGHPSTAKGSIKSTFLHPDPDRRLKGYSVMWGETFLRLCLRRRGSWHP
ncbi:hypothetical protein GJAV_G00015970 [Gymnothorax javanicus]|nr:hypothetical protein GJAV_G00015970 [Gymnothorax javanicus]